MRDLVIFGAGGLAREFHQIAEDVIQDTGRWNFLGFIDDNPERRGTAVHDYPVLGGTEWMQSHANVDVVVALGNPAVRRKVIRRLLGIGHRNFATLIHPTVWVGNRNEIGTGVVMGGNAVVSTDIKVGNYVVLNKNCTLGHDDVIGDFANVSHSSALSGGVILGEGVDLGANCTIIENITIGSWAVVGAGTVVVQDLPANVTAVGVPAKVIKERPSGWHEG